MIIIIMMTTLLFGCLYGDGNEDDCGLCLGQYGDICSHGNQDNDGCFNRDGSSDGGIDNETIILMVIKRIKLIAV